MKELPELHLRTRDEWEGWLEGNHDSSPGVWLRLAKKGAEGLPRAAALEVALCYGWIDGQAASTSIDASSWLQRFTPRTRRSRWSRINCEAADRYIASGQMKPSGLAEVEAAKRDGRWDRAYEPPSTIEIPNDLRSALEQHPEGLHLFEQLNASSRYAILYRIHDAKRPDTRARRIDKYIRMVLDGESIR